MYTQDADENIVITPADASAEQLAAVELGKKEGKLVDAEVWITRRVRHTAITSFLTNMVEIFLREGTSAAAQLAELRAKKATDAAAAAPTTASSTPGETKQ